MKNIGLVQMDVRLGQLELNKQRVEQLIAEAVSQQADIICLPETWNIGFFPKNKLHQLADVSGEQTKALLGSLAKKYGVNIVGGSVVNQRAGKIYNTAFVFNRQGDCIAEYDKIHGFSPSKEHEYFDHGQEVCVFSMDGVKMGLIICYDLRFPELVRTLALQGVQLMFVPAEWPHPRLEHWQVLLRARAIENQMFVAAVNGVGQAGDLQFCGHSMVIDPWGKVVKSAQEEEEVITAAVDLAVVREIRKKINVFNDRKPDLYSL